MGPLTDITRQSSHVYRVPIYVASVSELLGHGTPASIAVEKSPGPSAWRRLTSNPDALFFGPRQPAKVLEKVSVSPVQLWQVHSELFQISRPLHHLATTYVGNHSWTYWSWINRTHPMEKILSPSETWSGNDLSPIYKRLCKSRGLIDGWGGPWRGNAFWGGGGHRAYSCGQPNTQH